MKHPILCLTAAMVVIAGCVTSASRGSGDPSVDQLAVNLTLDHHDVQTMIEEVVSTFRESRFYRLQEEALASSSSPRPVLEFERMRNESDTYYDTDKIVELICEKIRNGDVFACRLDRSTDMARDRRTISEQHSEAESGRYNRGTLEEAGNRRENLYKVRSRLSCETEWIGRSQRKRYRIRVNIIDVSSQTVLWSETATATKQREAEPGLFMRLRNEAGRKARGQGVG